MSVVNKMLRDLDARKARDESRQADYQAPVKTRAGLWFVAVSVLVAVAGAGYWYGSVQEPVQHAVPIDDLQAAQNNLASNEVPTVAVLQDSAKTPSEADTKDPGDVRQVALQNTQKITQSDNVVATVDAQPKQAALALQKPPPVEMQTIKEDIAEPAESGYENEGVNKAELASAETKLSANEKVKEKVTEKVTEKPQPVFTIATSQSNTGVSGLTQQAQTALQLGDSAGARSALSQLLVLQPDNLSARKKLAALDFASGQTETAYTLLREGVALHPGSTEIRLMLARLLVQKQQKTQALTVLQAASPTDETGKDYIAYRAALAEQLQQHKQALQDYRTLASQYPQNFKWWLGLAISQERSGDKQAALLAYQQVDRLGTVSNEVSAFVRQRMNVLSEVQ